MATDDKASKEAPVAAPDSVTTTSSTPPARAGELVSPEAIVAAVISAEEGAVSAKADGSGADKPRKKLKKHTIPNTKRLTRSEREEMELLEELGGYPDVERPRSRADCQGGPRPCPFVSCKHHLYSEVNPETGALTVFFADKEPWEIAETCALDMADRGGLTLQEVGDLYGLTREAVRLVQIRGLVKLGVSEAIARHMSRTEDPVDPEPVDDEDEADEADDSESYAPTSPAPIEIPSARDILRELSSQPRHFALSPDGADAEDWCPLPRWDDPQGFRPGRTSAVSAPLVSRPPAPLGLAQRVEELEVQVADLASRLPVVLEVAVAAMAEEGDDPHGNDQNTFAAAWTLLTSS